MLESFETLLIVHLKNYVAAREQTRQRGTLRASKLKIKTRYIVK